MQPCKMRISGSAQMLKLVDVYSGYGGSTVLHGISLSVAPGEALLILGRNGVGKTTALRTVMGWIKPSAGQILLEGQEIGGLASDQVCRKGIGLIPEDRRVFPGLTVEENLRLGSFQTPRASKGVRDQRLAKAYEWFPILADRRKQLGSTLSGGEQQMLVLARAIMGDPKLLLIDEPSEGLAPKMVNKVFDSVRRMTAAGISILLVEQNVRGAMNVADRCVIVEKGRVVVEGKPEEIIASKEHRERLSV